MNLHWYKIIHFLFDLIIIKIFEIDEWLSRLCFEKRKQQIFFPKKLWGNRIHSCFDGQPGEFNYRVEWRICNLIFWFDNAFVFIVSLCYVLFEGLEIKTTYGTSLKIFGDERFKILEIIENCLRYRSEKVNQILFDKKAIGIAVVNFIL